VYDKQQLIALVREHALKFGDFTLASGKKASYYLDCRKVTLHSQGALTVAQGMLELLKDQMPAAVGGMAIGADPITAAIITVAATQGKTLKGFIVRKEAKAHGTGQDVEGPVSPGDTAVIVEDVISTGGSALAALDKAQAFGLKVSGVLGIIDRQMGGAEAFAARGVKLQTLLTTADFGLPPG
jgi:orotate phosphoribosyltransferase